MRVAVFLVVVIASLLSNVAAAGDARAKLSPVLMQDSAFDEHVDVVIVISGSGIIARADARLSADSVENRRQRIGVLQAESERTQSSLRRVLDARGIAHQDFWIANAIAARVLRSDLNWLSARADVARIESNAVNRFELPLVVPALPKAISAIEWGVVKVRAPEVWAMGINGQGVVIGGQDTGYQWDHPALLAHYRGWNGTVATHDYNWHDAIHGLLVGGLTPCDPNQIAPCDDAGHGSHTMGTMVGDDGGGNQVGVAPGARWIGCRNMDRGNGRPSTYLECFQWFMAPTTVEGFSPNPALAPDVINNSWSCPVGAPPSGEGCMLDSLLQAVNNARGAGIFVSVAAGNSGPSCSTITSPPTFYAGSFSVAATDAADGIAGFSSRGPVTVDGSGRLKPDISAPGVGVRSVFPGNSYSMMSGTSMASPHIVGVVALIIDANPALRGNVAMLEQIIRTTAVPLMATQDCGAFPGAAVPNAVFGYGRVDALAAVRLATGTLFVDGFE